jgi:hypothetical protein
MWDLVLDALGMCGQYLLLVFLCLGWFYLLIWNMFLGWIVWKLFLHATRNKSFARQPYPAWRTKWLPDRLTWYLWRRTFLEGVASTICRPRGAGCAHLIGSFYQLGLMKRPYPTPFRVGIVLDCPTPDIQIFVDIRAGGVIPPGVRRHWRAKWTETRRMFLELLDSNPVAALNYLLDWLIDTDALLNPPPLVA